MTRMASPEQFKAQIKHVALIYRTREDAKAELSIIGTALGSDTTTHDTTMQKAPGILQPGWNQNNEFHNRINLIVNRGKGGNLTTAEMSTVIGDVIAELP
jgi:hypothetical protein